MKRGRRRPSGPPSRGGVRWLVAAWLVLAVAVPASGLAAQTTSPISPPARPGGEAPDPPSFRVVVRSDHPLDAIGRSRLAKIFIKKITHWDDDTRIYPIDQLESSSIRDAFTDEVHRKSVNAVKSYWQRMIFSGRDVPPPEHAGDESVLAAVRDRPGAVGYVSPRAELGEGIKELEVVDD